MNQLSNDPQEGAFETWTSMLYLNNTKLLKTLK